MIIRNRLWIAYGILNGFVYGCLFGVYLHFSRSEHDLKAIVNEGCMLNECQHRSDPKWYDANLYVYKG